MCKYRYHIWNKIYIKRNRCCLQAGADILSIYNDRIGL